LPGDDEHYYLYDQPSDNVRESEMAKDVSIGSPLVIV